MVDRWTVRFGGVGGQGIVLSSVVTGLAAVYDGNYVCQRASYGSEARGGKCKSEVIISDVEISYPLIDDLQVLVIMSKQALDSYIDELEPGGLLIVDQDMVDDPGRRQDVEVLKIPAAKTADKLGNRIVSNMIMLGALQAKTGIMSKDALMKSMEDSVASRFIEINRKAIETGGQIVAELAAGDEASSEGQNRT